MKSPKHIRTDSVIMKLILASIAAFFLTLSGQAQDVPPVEARCVYGPCPGSGGPPAGWRESPAERRQEQEERARERQRQHEEYVRELRRLESLREHKIFKQMLADMQHDTIALPPPAYFDERKATGNDFFGIDVRPKDAPGIALLPGGSTPACQDMRSCPMENLRRAAAIIRALASPDQAGASADTLRFLADQAGKALAGESLQLVVPPAMEPNFSRSAEAEFRAALQDLQSSMAELSSLDQELAPMENRMSKMEEDFSRSTKAGYPPDLLDLRNRYAKSIERRAEIIKKLRDGQERARGIIYKLE